MQPGCLPYLIFSWPFCDRKACLVCAGRSVVCPPLLSLPCLFPLSPSFAEHPSVCGNHHLSISLCFTAAELEGAMVMVPWKCLAVEVPQFFNFSSSQICHLFLKNIAHPSRLQLNANRAYIWRVRFCSMIRIPFLQTFTFLGHFLLFSLTASDLGSYCLVPITMLFFGSSNFSWVMQ